MRKIILLNLIGFICIIGCSSQDNVNKFVWKDFTFEDAGIKISLPCEPSKEVKVFQKEPKLAQRYTFNCKKDNFEFSISLSEHFGDFSEDKAKETISFTEKMLKESIGDNADFSSKDISFEDAIGKEFNAKNESRLSKLIYIQNKRGAYNIQIISSNNAKKSVKDFDKEFEDISNKFVDSFKIIEQRI